MQQKNNLQKLKASARGINFRTWACRKDILKILILKSKFLLSEVLVNSKSYTRVKANIKAINSSESK